MEYRSITELNDRIVDWTSVLPRDFDLIVGIPRSGMLAANLLALHLHLPFTDLDGLCEGRIMASGQRGVSEPDPRCALRLLVVDDSVCSGVSMRRARAKVAAAGLPHAVRYGAVFVTPEAVREGEVDLFAEAVPMPRAFEWNILYTSQMDAFCIDLDGVLIGAAPADGPTPPVDAGCAALGEPRFLPRHRVGWLVTARPESMRTEIESWLARSGIEWERLVMSGAPLPVRHAVSFKARVYRETGATLFVEGDPDDAAAIAERAARPVFCFATRSMVYPGGFPRHRHVPVRSPHRVELALRWLARLPSRVLGRLQRLAGGAVGVGAALDWHGPLG